MPMSFCWDSEDARMLACETRCFPQSNEKKPPTSMGTMRNGLKPPNEANQSTAANSAVPESQIVVLFPTNNAKYPIKPMEYLNLEFNEQLVTMCTPYIVSKLLF